MISSIESFLQIEIGQDCICGFLKLWFSSTTSQVASYKLNYTIGIVSSLDLTRGHSSQNSATTFGFWGSVKMYFPFFSECYIDCHEFFSHLVWCLFITGSKFGKGYVSTFIIYVILLQFWIISSTTTGVEVFYRSCVFICCRTPAPGSNWNVIELEILNNYW